MRADRQFPPWLLQVDRGTPRIKRSQGLQCSCSRIRSWFRWVNANARYPESIGWPWRPQRLVMGHRWIHRRVMHFISSKLSWRLPVRLERCCAMGQDGTLPRRAPIADAGVSVRTSKLNHYISGGRGFSNPLRSRKTYELPTLTQKRKRHRFDTGTEQKVISACFSKVIPSWTMCTSNNIWKIVLKLYLSSHVPF